MTKKEAIKYLIRPVSSSTRPPSGEYLKQVEAYELAIKALMAYRDCRHCTHNIKIGNMRGCELGDCDFEDKKWGGAE